MNEKGFSFLEVLVAMTILSIAMMVLSISYVPMVKKTAIKRDIESVISMLDELEKIDSSSQTSIAIATTDPKKMTVIENLKRIDATLLTDVDNDPVNKSIIRNGSRTSNSETRYYVDIHYRETIGTISSKAIQKEYIADIYFSKDDIDDYYYDFKPSSINNLITNTDTSVRSIGIEPFSALDGDSGAAMTTEKRLRITLTSTNKVIQSDNLVVFDTIPLFTGINDTQTGVFNVMANIAPSIGTPNPLNRVMAIGIEEGTSVILPYCQGRVVTTPPASWSSITITALRLMKSTGITTNAASNAIKDVWINCFDSNSPTPGRFLARGSLRDN